MVAQGCSKVASTSPHVAASNSWLSKTGLESRTKLPEYEHAFQHFCMRIGAAQGKAPKGPGTQEAQGHRARGPQAMRAVIFSMDSMRVQKFRPKINGRLTKLVACLPHRRVVLASTWSHGQKNWFLFLTTLNENKKGERNITRNITAFFWC